MSFNITSSYKTHGEMTEVKNSMNQEYNNPLNIKE